jgi:NAD(P)-dependent dehydrogenase (short-subunit alcohol dehydrogenase family)
MVGELGQAIAYDLARAGCGVAVTARDVSALDTTLGELRALGTTMAGVALAPPRTSSRIPRSSAS